MGLGVGPRGLAAEPRAPSPAPRIVRRGAGEPLKPRTRSGPPQANSLPPRATVDPSGSWPGSGVSCSRGRVELLR